MKPTTIAVIGANGRSGLLFIKSALDAGYTVRAGVRNLAGFNLSEHANLTVLKVNATHPTDVGHLIKGADVVVSLIGHVKGSPATLQTDAMNVVVLEMEAAGLHRLISLTGTGVRFPGDKPSLIDRLLNVAIMLIDPERVSDGIAHAKVLQRSDLGWTILRVLKLGNGEPQPFWLTHNGPAKLLTSRQEVAEAILQIITKNAFVKQAPIISKATKL